MPFLTAKKIHDGNSWLPQGSVIEIADDGTVLSVQQRPDIDAVFYDGVLTPGFVNVHCHLELSHMKGLPEHTGLIPFLKTIPLHRNDYTEEQKRAARHAAHDELVKNGVVAVGDIANTADTLDLRTLNKLHFHTFVESIGFNDAKAPGAFNYAVATYNAFAGQQVNEKLLRQSIVPHAPYSVSATLFRLIDTHSKDIVISIHNQECLDEDWYYTAKEGAIPDLLRLFGIDDSLFVPSGRSSLQTYLEWFTPGHPFVFVHNTYTKSEDVRFAHSLMKEVYWCLCPNANLYIENTLPDIDMFIAEGANICIGTDSLASNHSLNVLSELISINEKYPHIGWEKLVAWATRNGARALQMDHTIGTLAVGKKPGILQLTGLENQKNGVVVNRIL